MMVLRSSMWAMMAFTLAATVLAVDCGRMCMMGGASMHMPCWLARHTGMVCDTGMLISTTILAMLGAFATILLWMRQVAHN